MTDEFEKALEDRMLEKRKILGHWDWPTDYYATGARWARQWCDDNMVALVKYQNAIDEIKNLRKENERLKKLVEDYKHKLFNVADPYADKLEKENEKLKARNAELISVLEYLDCNHATSRPFCDVIKKALAKNEGE